jgi:sirohydrochlorin ferrochelatase
VSGRPFILLIAHGSRRSEANEELRQTAQQLERSLSGTAVRCAFLEIESPDIATGLAACLEEGASRIRVLPYFLNSGRHVQEDIVRIVDQTRGSNPEADIDLVAHVGSHPGMIRLLTDIAENC